MNSLCSDSISYFVPQIAFCNQRLNIASKNHISYKCLFVRNVFEEFIRSVVISYKFSKTFRTRRSLEDVLLSESFSILVSRMRDKQIDMRCCLSVASSSNDYDNRTSGLRAQDVFAPFFLVLSLSVTKEKEKSPLIGGDPIFQEQKCFKYLKHSLLYSQHHRCSC